MIPNKSNSNENQRISTTWIHHKAIKWINLQRAKTPIKTWTFLFKETPNNQFRIERVLYQIPIHFQSLKNKNILFELCKMTSVYLFMFRLLFRFSSKDGKFLWNRGGLYYKIFISFTLQMWVLSKIVIVDSRMAKKNYVVKNLVSTVRVRICPLFRVLYVFQLTVNALMWKTNHINCTVHSEAWRNFEKRIYSEFIQINRVHVTKRIYSKPSYQLRRQSNAI